MPSPCTSVCKLDDRTGWCQGCFRTIDEIVAWARLSDEGRRRVWKLLPDRRAQAAKESP